MSTGLFDRRPSDSLIVLGEGARLERVFENLIENAISFSPANGLVTISAATDREMLVVRVEDEVLEPGDCHADVIAEPRAEDARINAAQTTSIRASSGWGGRRT